MTFRFNYGSIINGPWCYFRSWKISLRFSFKRFLPHGLLWLYDKASPETLFVRISSSFSFWRPCRFVTRKKSIIFSRRFRTIWSDPCFVEATIDQITQHCNILYEYESASLLALWISLLVECSCLFDACEAWQARVLSWKRAVNK